MTWIELPEVPGMQARMREPRAWFEFRNAADEAELLIFDEIGGWGLWADEFAEQLKVVTAPRLTVRLNSPGGSVFDGIAIANALRAHPATVTVRVEGLAASIASVIALAGDRVVAAPGAMFMIHDAAGYCFGQASDMAKMVEVLNKISDNIAAAYAAKAGGSREQWRERMLAETWYTAAEAVAAGLADELMEPDRDDDPEDARRMSARWDLSVFRYAGRENAPSPPLATAVGPHETATKEGTWDAGVEEKRLPSPVPVAVARRMYGWYDASKVEDGAVPKSACKLPHHFVSSGGEPGAASLNGVRNALARVPQTEGLSDAERATIERHLRSHLPEDADDQVPAPGDQAPAAAPPAASPPADSRPEPAPHPGPEGAGLADEWAAAVARLIPPADTWESLREALL